MKTATDKDLSGMLLDKEMRVPTSTLGRLARTGRSALGLLTSLHGLSGRDDDDLTGVIKATLQLGELKGAAMKVGQMMSYLDASLPDEARAILTTLQRAAVASELAEIRATVQAALGPRADDLLATMESRPVAVASVGQVHRARLPDGTEVAVKIRHPGIEEAMHKDFDGARLGSRFAQLVMPGAGARAREAIDEAREAFLQECDLELEASRQQLFRDYFAGCPQVRIPAVHNRYCARAVLTTTWLPGLTLEDFLSQRPSQAARNRAGEALFRFYLETLYRRGLFHADPHPGNFAFTAQGDVTFYDFGCVRTFGLEVARSLTDLVTALRTGDEPRQRSAARSLGFASSLEGDELRSFQRFARSFFAPVLSQGPSVLKPDMAFAAQTILKDKRELLRLGLPGKLLFLFRIRFGLYAVLARLGACLDWGELESSFATGAQK